MTHAELLRSHADLAIKEGGMYYSGEYLSRIASTAESLEAENAKLRELCATVIDDWMSKVCPTFPFCECNGEYQGCTDKTCGNQTYRQVARELGVEV